MTWLLQRNVIHDTIKLLTSNTRAEALRLDHCGFGCRCQLCSQDTHWLHFSVFCGRSSQPRGYYDAFATARAGCSAGREWLLPSEGTARAEVFCAFHFIVEPVGGCCCVSITAGLGVTCKLARHMTDAFIPSLIYDRYLRPCAGLLHSGWAAARRRRSAVIIAAGPSVAEEACKNMIVCASSAGDGSVPLGGTAAAALGLRWAPFTVEGQLLGGSQDTRHILAISQVCVSFVIEAVCSMACSVLARFKMFWIFVLAELLGAVCFSLFHCKAMTLLAIHCWSVLIFFLPRSISRAAARDRSSFELLAQHIS